MSKKTPVLHLFEQPIYPRVLYVCDGYDIDFIKEKFGVESGNLDLPQLSECRTITAFVIGDSDDGGITFAKSDRSRCIIVVLVHKNLVDLGVCAHEATHVSDKLWRQLSENNPGCEANAYFVEWVTKCIWEVKTGKKINK